jgi:ABC-2 type transport system permease protein
MSVASWTGWADPHRTRRQRLADARRSFAAAARLGWQVEANWADPFLFFVYSVARPIAGALILVVMIEVVSGGRIDAAFRAFVVVGSALWTVVLAGVAGTAWTVLDDRERYRMLKYLYVSPNSLLLLLLGRGIARLSSWAAGALITLAFGIAFLGVPFDVTRIDWGLLAASLAIGLVAIVSLGVVLGGIAMQTRQDAWQYPEAVSGALFLVVGAIFPLAVLPSAVQGFGLLLPLTWWLEGVRRALFPDTVSAIGGAGSAFTELTGAGAPSSATILLALLLTTAVVTLAAGLIFRWSERRAKEKGVFDQTTGS